MLSFWPVHAWLDNCMNRYILNNVSCKHVYLKTKCIWLHHLFDIVWGTGKCSLLHLNLAELCLQTYHRWHIVGVLCCLCLNYWRDSFCLWCAFCIGTSHLVTTAQYCSAVSQLQPMLILTYIKHPHQHGYQLASTRTFFPCQQTNMKMVSWWKSQWGRKKVISHIRTRKLGRILCLRMCNLHKIAPYSEAPEH